MGKLELIINADDFGLNSLCTEAIAQSFRKGLITDTTIVANGGAFDEAAKLATSDFNGKVGIHFNLTEGTPLTEDIKQLPLFCNDGAFHGKINRLKPLSVRESKAVGEELTAQCTRLLEAGINITHADSHHHIHTGIFIAPVVMQVCKENHIGKIRIHRNLGDISIVKKTIKGLYNFILKRKFTGTDYMGGTEDIDFTRKIEGCVEIMVHPDFDCIGNLIDKKGQSGSPLTDLKFWESAKRISYSQL